LPDKNASVKLRRLL